MPETGRQEAADAREQRAIPPVAVSTTTTLENKTGSWKYVRPVYRDRVAPCNEGCPVGIDIEAYLDLLRQEHVAEAVDLLLRENPMPATTGRVCHHPCENACNRQFLDGAVSIRSIERMLGDLALDTPRPERLPRSRREWVAVVGSGPAGLACAYHLARLGYGVSIFEADQEPGGALRTGIPSYRLPKDVLEREIERIRALGVEINCGVRVGLDLAWTELGHFGAVFLAPGQAQSTRLGIVGDDTEGVVAALHFLREINAGGAPDLGQDVVVIGGGNTALDCARSALRLGARPLVLYRRGRDEMPAFQDEIDEAVDEGVRFRFLGAPMRVRVRDGHVVGLDCVRTRLGEPDASGRRRPRPVRKSRFFLPADTVIAATGESLDLSSFPAELKIGSRGLEADEWGATSGPRFFAGGDIAEQPHTVADALGAGKRAAVGIDRFLRRAEGESVAGNGMSGLRYGSGGSISITRWRKDDPVARNDAVNEVVGFSDLNMDYFPHSPRHEDRQLSTPGDTEGFAEVNRGLGCYVAMEEARRCFNCGVCNQCEVCLIFCPDVAISHRADGPGLRIDYDYCKGCGVCHSECPRGAVTMVRETQ